MNSDRRWPMWNMNRRVLQSIVVLMLLTLVSLALTPQVCEAGHYEIRTNYFRDNSYTVLVGGKIQYCNGSISSWGTSTPYKQEVRILCPP
jgi:Family of unknown function (DUF6289)